MSIHDLFSRFAARPRPPARPGPAGERRILLAECLQARQDRARAEAEGNPMAMRRSVAHLLSVQDALVRLRRGETSLAA